MVSPINRWDRVPCPVCAAKAFRPCDYTPSYLPSGRTTHVERQWAVINKWHLDRLNEWQTVVCPAKDCAAEVGRRCKGTYAQYKDQYFTHLPRKRLVESIQKGEQ